MRERVGGDSICIDEVSAELKASCLSLHLGLGGREEQRKVVVEETGG